MASLTTAQLGRLPAECKFVGAALFAAAVVLTPRHAFWAFGVDAAVLVASAVAGRVPWRPLLRRFGLELPFVAVAVALPFVLGGRRVEVAGLALSVAGLWAAWGLVAKATLGVGAAAVVGATTPLPEAVAGFERLRMPAVFTVVASFMARYGVLLVDDARRMRVARIARCDDPRWLWQARGVAASAGTLFVRSYERGERVHRAMLARGWSGRMPAGPDEGPASVAQWLCAASPGAVGACCAALAAWSL